MKKPIILCVDLRFYEVYTWFFTSVFATGSCRASFAGLHVLMIEHKLGGGKTSANTVEQTKFNLNSNTHKYISQLFSNTSFRRTVNSQALDCTDTYFQIGSAYYFSEAAGCTKLEFREGVGGGFRWLLVTVDGRFAVTFLQAWIVLAPTTSPTSSD